MFHRHTGVTSTAILKPDAILEVPVRGRRMFLEAETPPRSAQVAFRAFPAASCRWHLTSPSESSRDCLGRMASRRKRSSSAAGASVPSAAMRSCNSTGPSSVAPRSWCSSGTARRGPPDSWRGTATSVSSRFRHGSREAEAHYLRRRSRWRSGCPLGRPARPASQCCQTVGWLGIEPRRYCDVGQLGQPDVQARRPGAPMARSRAPCWCREARKRCRSVSSPE